MTAISPTIQEPAEAQSPSTAQETAAGSWRLELDGGLAIHVPDRLSSLTTYVLLEQERWFEQEFDFVQRLLRPDSWVLDIGANHGLYALAIAQRLQGGRVIAFEPTEEPRSRMIRSILDNRLADRISVAPLGLSDAKREVEFSLSDNSELNSMHGVAGQRLERVQLDTLDAFLVRNTGDIRIDFVKLDAEGEEMAVLAGGHDFFSQQSPVVMFELMHGHQMNTELPARFEALGYGIYRHLPGLDLMAPQTIPLAPGDEVPLNLFAVKPERAAELARLGLLCTSAHPGSEAVRWSESQALAARHWLNAQTSRAGSSKADAHAELVTRAGVDACLMVASVHADPSLPADCRLARCHAALPALTAAAPVLDGPAVCRLATAVHALHLIGRRHAAVGLAQHLLAHWPRDLDADSDFLPPLASDLTRECTSSRTEWLKLVLAEFAERMRAFSSYFAPGDPTTLRRLLRHPDHSPEIERRYALGEFRQNRLPDVRMLTRLQAGRGSCNRSLWNAVLAEQA